MENSLSMDGVSLLEAVYERYSELSDLNGVHSYRMAYSSSKGLERTTLVTPSSPPSPSQPVQSADVEIQISPRRRQLLTSISMVLSDKNIVKVGEIEEVESVCQNVQELELSCNKLSDWNEIKNLFTALKRLRWLNLRANKLLTSSITESDQIKCYFQSHWPQFSQIKTLILDQCMFPFDLVVYLVSRLPQLTELHLTDNSYAKLDANVEPDLRHDQLKMLFLNQNSLSDWKDLTVIGKLFPNLEHLMLSENNLKNFKSDSSEDVNNADVFPKLKLLSVSKNPIDEWQSVDELRRFPSLEHVRIQAIPLLANINDDNHKFSLMVGFLGDKLTFLNGSPIKPEERETGERAFLRHFVDEPVKPERYYELEKKHGSLSKLVDIDLSKLGLNRSELLKQSRVMKRAVIKINFDDSNVVQVVETNVDLRQTVGEFKKRLEKHVGLPSSGFRIYFTDSDGSPYGPEELRHMNKTLQQAKIKENHEFIVILR